MYFDDRFLRKVRDIGCNENHRVFGRVVNDDLFFTAGAKNTKNPFGARSVDRDAVVIFGGGRSVACVWTAYLPNADYRGERDDFGIGRRVMRL
jgi:hypothetical protein